MIGRFAARTWALVWGGLSRMVASAGTRDAAQLAFYVLLAFPPLLLLVVWIFTAAIDTAARDRVVEAILHALPLSPGEGRSEVERILTGAASGAAGISLFGALVLLYSASGAMGALRHAVNQAWGTEEVRPAVPSKALDLGLVLVAAPLLMLAVAFNVSRAIPVNLQGERLLAGLTEVLLVDLLPLAIVFGVLLCLLRVLPAADRSWRAAWPGALAATIALQLVQLGARIYFSGISDANVLYGTLGVLLAVVLSVYLDAIAVVFGVHVSAQAARTRRAPAEAIRPEEPGEGPGIGRQALGWLRGLFVRNPRE
jgi:membrane protein